MHSLPTPATKRCLRPHPHNLLICGLHCKGTLQMWSNQGFGVEEIILDYLEEPNAIIRVLVRGVAGGLESEGMGPWEAERQKETWPQKQKLEGCDCLEPATWQAPGQDFLHPHTNLQERYCGFTLWMKNKPWGYGAQGHRKVSGCHHKTPFL